MARRVSATSYSQEHEDLETVLRLALSDPAVPLRDRVRMSCAFVTMMGGLHLGGEAFGEVSSDQLVVELKSAIHDLLDRR
jgi:hypothetical protein